MPVSAYQNVKAGFLFIKNHYWSLWGIILKSSLLLTLIGSFVVGIVFLSSSSSESIFSLSHSMDASFMGMFLSLPWGNIAVILPIVFMVLVCFLSYTVIAVSISRSVTLGEKLNTALLSRLFNRDVLRAFGVLLLPVGVLLLYLALMFWLFLSMSLHMISATVLFLPLIIYLFLRIPLVFQGIAVGDFSSLKEAFSKTKGKIWHIFKIYLITWELLILIELVKFLLSASGFLSASGLSIFPFYGLYVGVALAWILSIVAFPLYFLSFASFAHFYKGIRE